MFKKGLKCKKKKKDAEKELTNQDQILFSPKSGTYWRINPEDAHEIQCSSHPEGDWKMFYRFVAPIIRLAADDEHKCAAVTIKNIKCFICIWKENNKKNG